MSTKTQFKNLSWTQFTGLLVGLALAAALPQTHAASGDVDVSFDAGSTVNGTVIAIALQADGKVLIGGDFTTVHGMMRRLLARLNADGSTDSTFLSGLAGVTNANNGGSGWVWRIIVQPDQRILIAGYFSSVNGSPHNCIARLNPDGTVDDSFAASLEGPRPWVSSLARQGDGKVLVSGEFTSVNGVARSGLARLNPDGSLDASFVPSGGLGIIECIALQSDGKIVLGSYHGLARLNSDGSPDASFVGLPNPQGRVWALALQEDGKILFSGENFPFGVFCMARANRDGTLDTSFPVIDVGWASSILEQTDGKILIGGPFSAVGGTPRTMVARLNADGSLDRSFLDGLQSAWGGDVRSLALRPDGKILVAGNFVSSVTSSAALLNSNGSLDAAFSNGPTGPQGGSVLSIAVQPDGKPIIGGNFSTINGTGQAHLARLNPDGSLDTAFHANAVRDWGGVLCLAVQPDGKVLVGGDSVVRLNPDGSVDPSFRADIGDPGINALALQPDGRVLIGGWFTTVNGAALRALARLNSDGSLDTNFTIRLEPADCGVNTITLQRDGKVFIGGWFTSVNGLSRPSLARLNPNGSPDAYFVDVDGNVYGCYPLPDGKVLIWGDFTYVNGISHPLFARLNVDGSLDPAFVGGRNGDDTYTARAVALQADGKLLVARQVWCGSADPYFVRLAANGSVDDSFFAGQRGPDDDVDCLAVQPDGKLLLGGYFSVVNQTPCSGVVRLLSEYGPPALLVNPVNQTAELGFPVRFAVKATGYAVAYQWFFNGELIHNATNSVLLLPAVQSLQSGTYTMVLTNMFGALTSAPAMLSVIPPVERRTVPALTLTGQSGVSLNLEVTSALGPATIWLALDAVSLTHPGQFYFDLAAPLAPQRFYRAWQPAPAPMPPALSLHLVPALTLNGAIGSSVLLDYINQFGPTDAWVNLATVTLTNTTQLYFDTSAIGQPPRLWRIVPVP